MKKRIGNIDYYLSPEELDQLSLPEAEECALYLRYLIRREQQDYLIIKYQYHLEALEQRILQLQHQFPNQPNQQGPDF